MVRLYGWAERGERLVDAVPHGHWATSTFIAGLRQEGLVAPCVFNGAVNGELFLAYVEQVLVPTLINGDIVIWQQSWRAGSQFMPTNPVSGKPYRGVNAIALATEAIERGYTDNRWFTADQATKLGGTIKEGELGSVAQYWQFSFTDGDQTVKLEKPRTFNCVVFNAQQIDGLAELERSLMPFEQRTQQVANIVRGSRAAIAMDANGGPATYDRERDLIPLVRRDEQDNIGRRQIDVVDQIAHWTGPRLGRDIDHPVGSIGAAREELRRRTVAACRRLTPPES